MTYGILSLESGNLLESYGDEDRALEAAARICASESGVEDSFAVVTFDDEGMPVESLDGPALLERVQDFSGHHTATA